MTDLPNAPIKRIMNKAGAERMSASAVVKAAEAAESYLADLAKQALDNAANDRPARKTIMDKDIDAAREALRSGASFSAPVPSEPVAEESSEPAAEASAESSESATEESTSF
ncbi:MAG: histone-like protein [archaeon]